MAVYQEWEGGEMKKILIVSPGFSYGGSTTALISILNSSLTQEYQIDVFSIVKGDNTSPVLAQHNIDLNKWTNAFYANYSELPIHEKLRAVVLKILRQIPGVKKQIQEWVVRKTIKRLEKNNYDYVVAFQEKLATEFCQFFSYENKIAWLHCDFAKTYPRTDADLDVYNKYAKIVCVSNATRTSFLTYFPQLTERTTVIYNLFDSSSILQKSKDTIYDEKFDRESISIISVGRLNRVKRFDLIPHIARQVREIISNVKWYIIGQPYSDEEVKKLEMAIDKEGVRDTVVYLGGSSNPYPYFKAASLLVCVSASEACPMIFNEAKLLGLPIVSTDFASAYEFIEQGVDGMVTPLDGIANAVIELLQQESKHGNSEMFDGDAHNKAILDQLEQLFS